MACFTLPSSCFAREKFSLKRKRRKTEKKESIRQLRQGSLFKLMSSTSLLSTGIQFKQAIQSGWHHLCLNGMIVIRIASKSFQYYIDFLNFCFFFLLLYGRSYHAITFFLSLFQVRCTREDAVEVLAVQGCEQESFVTPFKNHHKPGENCNVIHLFMASKYLRKRSLFLFLMLGLFYLLNLDNHYELPKYGLITVNLS